MDEQVERILHKSIDESANMFARFYSTMVREHGFDPSTALGLTMAWGMATFGRLIPPAAGQLPAKDKL